MKYIVSQGLHSQFLLHHISKWCCLQIHDTIWMKMRFGSSWFVQPCIGPVRFSVVNRRDFRNARPHTVAWNLQWYTAFSSIIGGDQDTNNEHSAAQCVNSNPSLLSLLVNSLYLDLWLDANEEGKPEITLCEPFYRIRSFTICESRWRDFESLRPSMPETLVLSSCSGTPIEKIDGIKAARLESPPPNPSSPLHLHQKNNYRARFNVWMTIVKIFWSKEAQGSPINSIGSIWAQSAKH